MVTSWTGSMPARQTRQAWDAPEHLLCGATAFLAVDDQTHCPQCQARLHPLNAPLVAQVGGEAFTTHVNHANYCLDCPTVVVDLQRLRDSLGSRAAQARVVGVLVAGVSDRGNDSTVYPFDEVRVLKSSLGY